MTNKSLIDLIFPVGNLLLLFFNILFSFYQFDTSRKEKNFSEIANNVINQIFIPFQNSLGINLYKKINPQNWEEMRRILIVLKKNLDDSKESYYLSDNVLLSINKLEPYLNLTNLNKKDFKNLNKQFQKFSKNYLKEHSHFRKLLHLPINGAIHRLQFKLYKNHWSYLYLISKLAYRVLILIIISPLYFTIVLYIASWAEKISYFILHNLH